MTPDPARAAQNFIQGVDNLIKGNSFGNVVQDKTFENIESPINQAESMFNKAIEMRNEEWARADNIRKEAQEREDNALQRWRIDAEKAGINPNLALGFTGAASGGGISNETKSVDYTMTQAEYEAAYDKLMKEIDLKFQGSEAEKDRFIEIFKSLLTAGSIVGGVALKGLK